MQPVRLFAFGTLAALALAACRQEPTAPQEANPDAKPGLTASGGELVLPAVKGRPGAAYFELVNGSGAPVTLAAVSVAGAERAEMHETGGGTMKPLGSLELKPGDTTTFKPGGKHVMVFGLPPSLAAGSTIEMTLTFAGGDKLSTPLMVHPPGTSMADHEGH